jgi:UDP-N-acetylmuramate dehydrogenase
MNARAVANALQDRLRGRLELDASLRRFTTYRLGGPAAVLIEPAGESDLALLARALEEHGPDVPVLPIGRGSNLVMSDIGFEGVVVRIGNLMAHVSEESTSGLTAQAGVSMPVLANAAARRYMTGLEYMVAIPGGVGGGVRMNAGAHSHEVGDSLVAASVFELTSGIARTRTTTELGLTYRKSDLRDTEIVTSATFSLQHDDPAAIRKQMETYRRHRAETQPGAVQNAGSVFKNPAGDFAGRLVEEAGLKGFAVRGAKVSELHANFFIAGPGATAQDVFDLVNEVRARVADRLGIDLEPEIRFVGKFERSEAGTQ